MRGRWPAVLAVTLATMVVGVGPLASAHAGTAGLLANGGFEAGTAGWTADSWGSNTAALSLVPDAHSGATAARATITSYTDGDAKWIPDPATVTSGASYTYRDWYELDTTTHLWARFTGTDGSVQYLHLAALAPAASWTPASVDIVVPDGAAQLSVFQVLAGVGSVTVDDVALTADAPCATSAVNGLPNGDFEDACPTTDGVPAGWTATPSSAGNVTYSDAPAASGAHAVGVTNSVDGQEAGLSAPVGAPASNQRYSLAFEQAGNTYVYAYLTFVRTNGTTTYQSLPSAPATDGAWSQYRAAFVTPANTKSLTVTIATSGLGTVAFDAVSLSRLANQVPATFNAGLVSVTFDDGDGAVYTNALPTLKSYGWHGTFYLNAETINSPGFLTTPQVRSLAAAGNEIGSHLYHHSDLAQLDDATLRSELSGNVAALQRILGTAAPINAFASPYGSYTSGALDTVMQYASSHRTSDGAMNTKADLDPRTIHAKLVTSTMTAADITALVRQALTTHSWLVLVYHNVAAATATQPAGEAGYTVTPAAFKNQMAAIRKTGVGVQPVSSALATLQKQ
jgi:peptidoglycan/xylan/chitin deacetylase (PgdA/CDA1 family)